MPRDINLSLLAHWAVLRRVTRESPQFSSVTRHGGDGSLVRGYELRARRSIDEAAKVLRRGFPKRCRIATLPAIYRSQKQENWEIPFSESKNTLFHLRLETHSNCLFRAFNSSLLEELPYEGGIKCP